MFTLLPPNRLVSPPWRAAGFLGLALVCGSCAVGPDFVRPEDPATKAYTTGDAPPPTSDNAEAAQHFALGEKIRGDWWEVFHAPQLNDVLQQAIADNLTVAAAKATLAQAREVLAQAGGARYPQIGFAANATRQGKNYASSGIDQTGPTSNLFTLGPTASYTLDLFGGIERQIEKQGALAEYQAYQLNAAYLTLTGNAVTQAVQIASARAQIKAAEEIIAVDQRNLDSVNILLDVRAATQIELASAKSQLTTDRSLLPPLRQQLSVARHALSVLVGKAPADWSPPDFDLEDFKVTEDLPVSLPSELVHQRPDVLAAEAQVHAASAAVGIATAQLYPNITLSAGMAQQALSTGNLFSGIGSIWNIAANLTAPIFNGGALEAQRRAAEEGYNSALLTYKQTVLQSFGQVADILEALTHDAELVDYEWHALEATKASMLLTRNSYTGGQVRFLEVLDAERLHQRALLGYARAVAQRYLDTAQLFLAMGGGRNWSAEATTAEASPTPGSAIEPGDKPND